MQSSVWMCSEPKRGASTQLSSEKADGNVGAIYTDLVATIESVFQITLCSLKLDPLVVRNSTELQRLCLTSSGYPGTNKIAAFAMTRCARCSTRDWMRHKSNPLPNPHDITAQWQLFQKRDYGVTTYRAAQEVYPRASVTWRCFAVIIVAGVIFWRRMGITRFIAKSIRVAYTNLKEFVPILPLDCTPHLPG